MTLLDRRVAERLDLLDGCFNFGELDRGRVSQARLASIDGYRGPHGQVPVRTRPRHSAGVDRPTQLAAFLGRPV
jgi:hypothetical protein